MPKASMSSSSKGGSPSPSQAASLRARSDSMLSASSRCFCAANFIASSWPSSIMRGSRYETLCSRTRRGLLPVYMRSAVGRENNDG